MPVQEQITIRSGWRRFNTLQAKYHTLKTVLIFLCSTLLFTAHARAGKVFPLSIEQLTSRAQLVLHGSVASTSVQRDPEGRIYTRIELQVAETWKGQTKNGSFTLVQGGGVLGEEVAMVSGQETFSVGEEVVVFLVLNQRGEGVVIGLNQGKFKVRGDGNEKSVHNMFHGRSVGAERSPNAKAQPQQLTLGGLKQRVQGGQP